MAAGSLLTSRPVWTETPQSAIPFPPFSGTPDEVEVAIIGGGITGLTAALLLHLSGRKVALFERERIGSGESGRTTAHLTEVIDTGYHTLISDYGTKGARLARDSNQAAIEEIRRITSQLDAPCGFSFVPGCLFAETRGQLPKLRRECRAMEKIGMNPRWSERVSLPFPVKGAVFLEGQAQFHPREYLLGMARLLAREGCPIFENSPVVEIQGEDPCLLRTARGELKARQLFLATDSPLTRSPLVHTRIASYRTYAVASRVSDEQARSGLFWDLANPYHYIRTQSTPRGTYLIVGGEDHKAGHLENTQGPIEKLSLYTQERFGVDVIDYAWSGQVEEPVDGLPLIGKKPGSDSVYIATGYSGNGMTFGTVAAMIITDLILKRPNPWAELYAPSRFKPLAAASDFIKENLEFPMNLAREFLSSPPKASADLWRQIQPGEGRILRIEKESFAVHRDATGNLHAVSPTCTHLGCQISWNKLEQSWDCPCHGSRFGPDGEVLRGPATQTLKRAEIPEFVQEAERDSGKKIA